MAYGSGAATSGISHTPMGRVVAGGLFAGYFIDVIFVPLLYLLIDDLRLSFGWLGCVGQRVSTNGTPSPMEES